MNIQTDFLVIGSGLGGMYCALELSRHGKVILITKRELTESNTRYAQGGIAAVIDPDDDIEKHVKDTVVAGAYLGHEDAIRAVIAEGPAGMRQLVEYGVDFSPLTNTRHPNPLSVDLTREGGHSHRRILHVKDYTGQAVEETLADHVRANENIEVLENHVAVDLITGHKLGQFGNGNRVYGAYVLDVASDMVKTFSAPYTVLATGGTGKVYRYTSNPDVATGDGIAMAWRAGARVANMEMVQFHPTCLYHPFAKSFLISESMRGEGAVLLDPVNKQPFMHKYHELKDLAPRDIVARAIDHEIKKSGADHVWLDISHKDGTYLRNRFPLIYSTCISFGIDLTREPIPVVPAAHYQCGGVAVDLKGHTDIDRLYAVGEVTCTGLHGANRLASNSLLECIAYARIISRDIAERIGSDDRAVPPIPPWDPGEAVDIDELVVINHNWDEIRRFMWDYVGIVRTTKRLERALRRNLFLQEEIMHYYWNFRLTRDLIELRNLAHVAELIIRCALQRKESRGLHYTLDYPQTDDANWKRDTVLVRE